MHPKELRRRLAFALFTCTLVACSSSGSSEASSPTVDGGPQPAEAGIPPSDASPPQPGPPLSGTTGDVCAKDVDCKGEAVGARCSAELLATGATWPSPVCVIVNPTGASVCSLGGGESVPLCDGDRGLCVRNAAGTNDCLPACKFARDGAALRPCAGANACNVQWLDATGAFHGFCYGGCVADGECPTGNACDVVTGLCMKACKTDPDCAGTGLRCDTSKGACVASVTKTVGDACKGGDECNCLLGKSGAGVCISACRTGTTSCAAGFSCDPLLGLPDGPAKGLASVPAGLAGACLKTCSSDAECGGGACLRSPGMTVSTCRPR